MSAGRFEVVVEEGVPGGGLYELEQTTCHHVVDTWSNRTVATFEGRMEASLSRETGLWGDSHFSGVAEVSLVPDRRSILVRYYDGGEELVPLPE